MIAGTKVAAAIRLAAARLGKAGIDTPRLDARLLVEATTGLRHEQILIDPTRALSDAEAAQLAALVQRRLAREPVTRILGERHFYGRVLKVTPDTLDPRPETETLVELALELLRADGDLAGENPLLVDIGTGTGCIVLTLLAELSAGGIDARGLGVDISEPALHVARDNAARLGLEPRVRWQRIANFSDVDLAGRTPRLIVSNPPYIPSADLAGLDPEVRDHDPRVALDGGPDGLNMIGKIVDWSAGNPGTWFAMEIGAGQADAVVGLISDRCGGDTARHTVLRRDLGGHIRCVAWKPQT